MNYRRWKPKQGALRKLKVLLRGMERMTIRNFMQERLRKTVSV